MFRTVLIPIDGSEFSARAVPVGAAIARASRADVLLLGVARSDAEVAWTYDRVKDARVLLGPAETLEGDMIVDPDPAHVLLDLAGDPRNVLCLASHDHGKVAATARRSVGSQVIERAAHSLVVVGPNADASRIDGDVVVALDGVEDPEPLLAAAADWARRFAARLRIVTVYEPVLADLRRPSHFTRQHGPPGDPDVYLETIARRIDGVGLPGVELVAIPDPVSVVAGVAQHLEDHPAFLLVAGGGKRGASHISSGVLGDLVRTLTLPILVVNGSRT
jgi:nucleotide-binding universal stress UspA family protein